MKSQATFSELLQAFFTERLMDQCNASPRTIANYRDTFRLLLAFAQRRLKKIPTALPTFRVPGISSSGGCLRSLNNAVICA